jgi:hypothetical protein
MKFIPRFVRNEKHKTQILTQLGPTLRRRKLQEQQQTLTSGRYHFFLLLLTNANMPRLPVWISRSVYGHLVGHPRTRGRSIARPIFTTTIHPHTKRDTNRDPRCTSDTSQYASWPVFPLGAIADGVNSDPDAHVSSTPYHYTLH